MDGVVLKRTVDAWVAAPDSEKAARFASAEATRWLEEGLRGYEELLFGLTLLLLAALIVWTARIPRPIGYLLGLSAVAYVAEGWIDQVWGFVPQSDIPGLIAQISPLVLSISLLVAALRMTSSNAEPAATSR